MKLRMLILCGLPASGKSTFANDLMDREYDQWVYINWDAMRRNTPGYKFSWEAEKKIKNQSYDLARVAAVQGKNVIVDNTNLTDKSVVTWVRLAAELGMIVKAQVFTTPVEECVRRDALRTGPAHVGRVCIERMALDAGLIHFPADKKIVIVDVDGTLANNTHRLRQKQKVCKDCKGGPLCGMCPVCQGKGTVIGTDWDYFYQPGLIGADDPFPVVADWTRELYLHYTVLIVSGRPENRAAEQTVNWLAKNEIPYHHIFMRRASDMRDDVIVKQEILDKILLSVPKNRIAFTIDDRSRVVSMWRKNGVKCYQVVSREEGNF